MPKICNRDEFESALDEIIQMFDHPPAKGSADDARFPILLDRVARYREEMEPRAEHPLSKIERLDEHLRRMQSSLPNKEQDDGIGPTLGMDLSHS